MPRAASVLRFSTMARLPRLTEPKLALTPSGDKGGPNYTLKTNDFPFHQLAVPTDRESAVLYDSHNVVSSIGVFGSVFRRIGPTGHEKDTKVPDPMFNVGGVQTRRVEPRNTPTVINAVLNFRNFWDGRANDIFNGVNPFGPRDPSAHVWMDDWVRDEKGVLVETAIPALMRMQYASAASQAVGPALSDFEMSASSRSFPDLGRKLLLTQPLKQQKIASDDGVLGPYRDPAGKGLNTDYETLIHQAFWPELWQTPDAIFFAASHARPPDRGELLHVLGHDSDVQSTLISDDSRFDQFATATYALTPQERLGLALFNGKDHCVTCHKGAGSPAPDASVLGAGIDVRGDGDRSDDHGRRILRTTTGSTTSACRPGTTSDRRQRCSVPAVLLASAQDVAPRTGGA
jgi:hypothetical protein